MAAYSTLHLAHLSRLFSFRQTPSRLDFYIFTPRGYRSDVSPSAVNYSGSEQSPAVDNVKSFSQTLASAVSPLFASLCLFFVRVLLRALALCAAGLIISHCTAGLGQMWILYSSDHRLYTFISSHSPQRCKCHVGGWGRRGEGALADWAWWGGGPEGGMRKKSFREKRSWRKT